MYTIISYLCLIEMAIGLYTAVTAVEKEKSYKRNPTAWYCSYLYHYL